MRDGGWRTGVGIVWPRSCSAELADLPNKGCPARDEVAKLPDILPAVKRSITWEKNLLLSCFSTIPTTKHKKRQGKERNQDANENVRHATAADISCLVAV